MTTVSGRAHSSSEAAAHFRRAAAAFDQLRDLTPGEREARLAAACDGDLNIMQEVRELLAFHDAAPGGLDRGVMRPMTGVVIGRYRIESVIGEGGMGTVYRAEQLEPVRRRVALKVVKLGMDTAQVVRRFESERQVLARMEHPGIAQVFDGGVTPDGRPFFVMELVHGESIRDYCRRRRLGVTERIELFLRVCAAVQHAHQKGVLHRDLKPGNILVSESGGEALPKVIDFGVAKALDPGDRAGAGGGGGASAPPSLTIAHQGAVGTIDYMSPEQAGSGEDPDIRSDVYALGVTLFELLVGRTPLRSRARRSSGAAGGDVPLDELRRRIRDEDPIRPSSALALVAAPGDASLRRALRGDLDWIILKAIAREPARRYGTVAAFALDLGRFLKHEPVEARPPSLAYRFHKFAQRHMVVLVAATAVMASLITGLVISISLWRTANIERDDAVAAKDRESRLAGVLKGELFSSDIERGRNAARQGNMALARELLWKAYRESPDSPHARWGLRELYLRRPCLSSAALPGRPVTACFVDAERVAVAMLDSPPVLVDTRSAAVIRKFAGPDSAPESAPVESAASADGEFFAVASMNGEVRLYRVADGADLGVVEHHGPGAASVVFSRDGRFITTAGADGRVVRRSVLTSAPQPAADAHVLHAFDSAVVRVTIGPRDELALILADGRTLVSDGVTATVIEQMRDGLRAVALSSDGSRIATGALDREIRVFDVATRTLVTTLRANMGAVRDLAFTAGDTRILVVGWWELTGLDLATGAATTACMDFGARFTMSPDQSRVALSVGTLPTLRTWRLGGDGLTMRSAVAADSATRFTPFRDGFIRADASTLCGFDLEGHPLWSVPTGGARLLTLSASSSAGTVAALCTDGHLRAWRVPGGEQLCDLPGCIPNDLRCVALDPSGESVAFPGERGVEVADLRNCERHLVLPDPGDDVLALAFTADGGSLAASVRDRGVHLLTLSSGDDRFFPQPSPVFAISFVNGGSTILLGNWEGELVAMDLMSGSRRTLHEHSVMVGFVAPSPSDPEVVLTSGPDGTVRLWHLGLGRCVLEVEPFGPRRIVRAAAFSADGSTIMAVGAGGEIVHWSIPELDAAIAANAGYELVHPPALRDVR